jgi:hypothetical protein
MCQASWFRFRQFWSLWNFCITVHPACPAQAWKDLSSILANSNRETAVHRLPRPRWTVSLSWHSSFGGIAIATRKLCRMSGELVQVPAILKSMEFLYNGTSSMSCTGMEGAPFASAEMDRIAVVTLLLRWHCYCHSRLELPCKDRGGRRLPGINKQFGMGHEESARLEIMGILGVLSTHQYLRMQCSEVAISFSLEPYMQVVG